MATVTVLTSDRIISVENLDVVGGVVDESGDLILTKRNGDEINLGNVKLHSQLYGLDQDDHPQYALSDGTRGEFATIAQGEKADAARPNLGSSIVVDGGDPDAILERFTITGDGTDTSTWVNRMVFQFREDANSTPRSTTAMNEYGELRVAPAKHNTVGARFFIKEFPDNPSTPRDVTVPVIELMNDRVNRESLWSIMGDGLVHTHGIPTAYTVVLGPTESIPANLPIGTVILRTE